MGRGFLLTGFAAGGAALIGFQQALVLVVVAVKTQQFPVAAVGRIIIVVVVAMMHRQLMQICAGEFPLTATANPGIQLQCLLAVAQLTGIAVLVRCGDQLVQASVAVGGFLGGHNYEQSIPLRGHESCLSPKFTSLSGSATAFEEIVG